MDEIATKALSIGVAIFVTIIIFTVVILEFDQISEIYSQTAETNVTFEERLDEFDKYRDSNNEFIGLDVVNTVSKYKNNSMIQVCIQEGTLVCDDSINISQKEYYLKYNSNFVEVDNIYRIIFSIKGRENSYG